ncbi:DeoR/GlpR family DNA-binding transcription regulator [Thermostaphylospora chromogena]|uniref:DNA-binding transcriptional regulator of sugar metabolism, DeoR/GlpR family n=1 Tax=Thermostaphylospora chromogena TaxID=35622 RepID=A0A1H1GSJ8_9ACTN|nr:DeoR/GlpR family DNA-binding transcription regulator [Thermostaphylospora chromogena]SDR16033.1 DNA-binding transcriptional regulator of sugar metabolism, DeoR/GlpR family [Thermostaphylospora chromogena]
MRKNKARQNQIADLILEHGSMTAQELAERFGVSVMTIHRDLDELERQGVLRKARGVATAQPSGVFESRVAFRHATAVEQKRRIARAALRHVEPGMSLILDDSTTVLHMVKGLGEHAPLHVATNFLAGLNQLTAVPDIRVIAIGGDYDPLHDSFQGMHAIEAIEAIHADALFMSTSAVSGGHAYHQEDRVVAFKRAMIESASARYLLVDHTKLDKTALHRLAPLTDFDLVITDSGVSPEALAALEAAGVPVEVAP